MYEVLAKYPNIIALEDNTWPEENSLLQPFAFIPEEDQNLLFSSNRVNQNCLTDCEYLVQGFYPSIMTRWWQKSIQSGLNKGFDIVNGRTFFWDRGCTDFTFNRMNAYMLTRFCYTPDANPRDVFKEAAIEFMGEGISDELIDVLFEVEIVLQKIAGYNGEFKIRSRLKILGNT